MAKSTEKYELLYIIDVDKTEEETAAIVERFKSLIEANGELVEMEEWGKRKLAISSMTSPRVTMCSSSSAAVPNFPQSLTVSCTSPTASSAA